MSKSKLRTEKYPLPQSADAICSLVKEILQGGSVKRIEMDVEDANVRAYRWVEDVGLEEDDITWDGAVRNVEVMREYYSDGATSFQVVADMMFLAKTETSNCVCWVTGTDGPELMRKWFAIDERGLPLDDVSFLFGLPVRVLKSLPAETLILCCSRYPSPEPSDIHLAVKTTMEMRREQERGDANRGGNHSQEHPSAAGKLALTTSGLRRVAWQPPRDPGHEQP